MRRKQRTTIDTLPTAETAPTKLTAPARPSLFDPQACASEWLHGQADEDDVLPFSWLAGRWYRHTRSGWEQIDDGALRHSLDEYGRQHHQFDEHLGRRDATWNAVVHQVRQLAANTAPPEPPADRFGRAPQSWHTRRDGHLPGVPVQIARCYVAERWYPSPGRDLGGRQLIYAYGRWRVWNRGQWTEPASTTARPDELADPIAEDIADKDATVEGEDEQYAPPRKSEIELPRISDGQLSRWEDEVRALSVKEKQGTKLLERKALIRAEYGTQNALGAQIFITKKDEFGAYLIDYRRNKYDYEAYGKNTVTNSALSHDALKLLGQLNFSQSYKMLLRTEYLETARGFQGNSVFGGENKKLGLFQWENLVRPGDNQRLTAGITGSLGKSTVTQTGATTTRDADFKSIKAQVEWQYIFGERNAFTLAANLWYGENTDYTTSLPQYYRAGNAEARNVFPLARFLIGEEQQALQIDLTVGAKIFFAQAMQPVPAFTPVSSTATVVLNHLEALDHCPTTRAALRARVRDEGLSDRVCIPDDGETLSFESTPTETTRARPKPSGQARPGAQKWLTALFAGT